MSDDHDRYIVSIMGVIGITGLLASAHIAAVGLLYGCWWIAAIGDVMSVFWWYFCKKGQLDPDGGNA